MWLWALRACLDALFAKLQGGLALGSEAWNGRTWLNAVWGLIRWLFVRLLGAAFGDAFGDEMRSIGAKRKAPPFGGALVRRGV